MPMYRDCYREGSLVVYGDILRDKTEIHRDKYLAPTKERDIQDRALSRGRVSTIDRGVRRNLRYCHKVCMYSLAS